jgi:hypothetical protein
MHLEDDSNRLIEESIHSFEGFDESDDGSRSEHTRDGRKDAQATKKNERSPAKRRADDGNATASDIGAAHTAEPSTNSTELAPAEPRDESNTAPDVPPLPLLDAAKNLADSELLSITSEEARTYLNFNDNQSQKEEPVVPSLVHARPPPAAAAGNDDTMANDGKRAAKPKSKRQHNAYQLFIKVVNSVDIQDGLDPKVYGDKRLIDQMWNEMNQPRHQHKKRRVHRKKTSHRDLPFVDRSRRCAAVWGSLNQTKEGRATRDYYSRRVSSC